MTKNCPKCGESVPDDAKFCMNCGHAFTSSANNIFSNGKIFLIIIAVVVILGLIVIGLTGSNNNTDTNISEENTTHIIDLSINGVGGFIDEEGKPSYTLYTEVLFLKVPDDIDNYKIKTTYYDSSDKEIGHEVESMNSLEVKSDYETYIGYYTTYQIPNPDYVKIDILKDGKTVDTFKEKIDVDRIDFLN